MCGQPGSLSVHTLAQEPLPQHMCPCHVSMPCVKNTGHSSCACSLDASSKAALKSLELRMSEPQVPEPPVSQPWSHCCSVNAYTLDLRSVTGSQRTVPCIPVVMLQWEDLSPKHWNCQHSELWSHHLSMHACARCMCTHTHTHTCMCKSMLLHSKLNSQTEKWAEELNRHFKKKKKKDLQMAKKYLKMCSSLIQFSSVTQLCPTLCDSMNRSTAGLPVHHQLQEFTQTHVHRVGDAIQPSHPLLYRKL